MPAMIVAGIDEAGYGPLLGPLVVGCCAFEATPDEGSATPPCLWKRLRRLAGKSRDRKGRKLHINDSKLVYSPAAGLKELERSILAVLATMGDVPGDLVALLSRVAPEVVEQLGEYPWYAAPAGEKFPVEHEAVSIRLLANALSAEMQRSNARCVYLAARVLPERHLNRQFAITRNKSNVLFSAAACHLDYLLRTFGQSDLHILCDRQGGREHYGHLLRLMFEDWDLEITAETDGRAEYRLIRGGHTVSLTFCEKAESQCMPVALASMLCKYLREVLMRRFNAFWKALLPSLEPTAGYYGDGMRFLKEIEGLRKELGVGDEMLVRSR